MNTTKTIEDIAAEKYPYWDGQITDVPFRKVNNDVDKKRKAYIQGYKDAEEKLSIAVGSIKEALTYDLNPVEHHILSEALKKIGF